MTNSDEIKYFKQNYIIRFVIVGWAINSYSKLVTSCTKSSSLNCPYLVQSTWCILPISKQSSTTLFSLFERPLFSYRRNSENISCLMLLKFSCKILALFPFHGYFAPTVLSLREMGFTGNSIHGSRDCKKPQKYFWTKFRSAIFYSHTALMSLEGRVAEVGVPQYRRCTKDQGLLRKEGPPAYAILP